MKNLLIAAGLILPTGILCAQNVSFNNLAGSTPAFQNSIGNPIPNGSTLLFGVVSSADGASSILETSSDYNQVLGAFDTIATFSFSNANGRIGATIENVSASFYNKTLIIWALNAPSGSLSTATEWAMFSDPSWTITAFPSLAASTTTLDSSDFLRGSVGSGAITLAAIPEPSSFAVLMGAAALALVGGRRRRVATIA